MSKETYDSPYSDSIVGCEKSATIFNDKKISKVYLFSKRMIDIFFAISGLIITSPIFGLVAILYLFGESKGPLLFKQKRYGKGGKIFHIYKFRSMVINADEKLRSNRILYERYIKNNYKLAQEEDPRITKVGRILRKTSLDELPQLINVLRGNMSLIGPRPIVEDELKEYKEKKHIFLSVKPGITGYWQVKGRSNIGYPERVEVELYYIYNRSIVLDFKILLKTFTVIFSKNGAY